MELVRWNPWREMFSVRNRANSVFDEFFHPAGVREDAAAVGNWNPVVDVYENDDHFVIKADLPGIDKKDCYRRFKNQPKSSF